MEKYLIIKNNSIRTFSAMADLVGLVKPARGNDNLIVGY
jgi:hypothetical protein